MGSCSSGPDGPTPHNQGSPAADAAMASTNRPALNEAGLPVGYPFRPEWEVTPRQVRQWLESGRVGKGEDRGVLLDCRRSDEWERSRIDGAMLIPMLEIERRADELEDDQRGRARMIVVYCHHGARSLRVAAALRAMGFADVRSMAGGIDLWSMDIDASVPRY